MKPNAVIFFIIASAVITVIGSQKASAQSLLLYYDFNGDASSTFATNKGSLAGNFDLNYRNAEKDGTTQGSTPGVKGGEKNYALDNATAAWNSKGGSAKSTTANFQGLKLESFTMTFWANPTGNWGNNSRIMDAIGNQLVLRSASNGSLWLTLQPGTGKEVASVDGFLLNQTSGVEWTFYAITFTQGAVHFYRGGETTPVELVSTVTTARDGSALPKFWEAGGSNSLFALGNTSSTNQDRAMKGLLDEFRFYGAETGQTGALSLPKLEEIHAIQEPHSAPH